MSRTYYDSYFFYLIARPDGVCHGDTKGNTGKGCDCGEGVSCGEYLWDHRNETLTMWFTEQYVGHPLPESSHAPVPWHARNACAWYALYVPRQSMRAVHWNVHHT